MITTLLLTAALAGPAATPAEPAATAEPQLIGEHLEEVRDLVNAVSSGPSSCTSTGSPPQGVAWVAFQVADRRLSSFTVNPDDPEIVAQTECLVSSLRSVLPSAKARGKVLWPVWVGPAAVGPQSAADAPVVRTMRKKQSHLSYCYEYQLRSDVELSGRVVVRWNVAAGRVTATEVAINTTGNADLGRCIAKKIAKWRFPSDVEGETVWPFVFRKI